MKLQIEALLHCEASLHKIASFSHCMAFVSVTEPVSLATLLLSDAESFHLEAIEHIVFSLRLHLRIILKAGMNRSLARMPLRSAVFSE